MFDILHKVTSALSSADVLFSECPWSLYTCIPDPTSATPVYLESSRDCDGLLGCCVSCSLWSSFCHSPENPFGLVSARSAFPHPGASSRMSLYLFCATLFPMFITWCPCYHVMQQGLQRDCAFCSRGDSSIRIHFIFTQSVAVTDLWALGKEKHRVVKQDHTLYVRQ